jgi:alkanesulfonate monooxygenase
MTTRIFWRLPVDGDGWALRSSQWNRGDYSALPPHPNRFARTGGQDGFNYFDHLSQITRAAELAGFEGLWIPQSRAGEEPLIVASAFAREARRLQFVTSLWTPLLSAVYEAKIANSFQRLTRGRLAWNFVTESPDPRAWHGQGSRWNLADQVARTDEFLEVAAGFWNKGPFTFKGRFYEVENGGFPPSLGGETLPTIYISGTSDEELALGARRADVHVLPIAPLDVVREQIAKLQDLAATHGRRPRVAIEADVVARYSDEDAWRDIRGRWEDAADKTVPISTSSVSDLPVRTFDDLVTGDHLWNGFGTVRPGPATGLVGGYQSIIDRLVEYARAGVSTFVLSANPHLEEAYRLGEHLLPALRAQIAQLQSAAA